MPNIPGGGFLVARKMFTSKIWMKDPLYLKLWIWLIGRACWQDHEKGGYTYRRGEIVTTYNEIRESLVYFHNRKKNLPTQKKIRVMLKWLENNQMIRVEPLKTNSQKAASAQLAEPCQTGAYTTPSTRAHHGIKIIVVNYDSYQNSENYRAAHKGRNLSEQGHNINKEPINKQKSNPDFCELKKRYSDPLLIDKCFAAIAGCRKSGKIADSVVLAQLQKWEKYPVAQVEAGIRIYLDKDYASQGRDEKYLLGIIRGQTGNEVQQNQYSLSEPPPQKIFSVNDPETVERLLSND